MRIKSIDQDELKEGIEYAVLIGTWWYYEVKVYEGRLINSHEPIDINGVSHFIEMSDLESELNKAIKSAA